MTVLLDGRIACGCDDGTILIFYFGTANVDDDSNEQRWDREAYGLSGNSGQVNDVYGDVHGGDRDRADEPSLHVRGMCRVSISQTLKLHTAGVTGLCLLPTVNGDCRLGSSSWDGTVRYRLHSTRCPKSTL